MNAPKVSANAAKAKSWFWNKNGKAQGPSSLDEMELLVREGTLLKHDLVFQEGGLSWQEAGTLHELSAFFAARESLTTPAESETAEHWILLKKETREDGVFFRQKGPFTVAEVQEQLRLGQITLRDHAWTEGMKSWAVLSEIESFAHGNHKINAEDESLLSAVEQFVPMINELPPSIAPIPLKVPAHIPKPPEEDEYLEKTEVFSSPTIRPSSIATTAPMPPAAPVDEVTATAVIEHPPKVMERKSVKKEETFALGAMDPYAYQQPVAKASNRWLPALLFAGALAGIGAVVFFPENGTDFSNWQNFFQKAEPVSEIPIAQLDSAPPSVPAPVPPAPVAPTAVSESAPPTQNVTSAPAVKPVEEDVAESSNVPAATDSESVVATDSKTDLTFKNNQIAGSYDSRSRTLELRGPFKKNDVMKVSFSAAPGQVLGIPSLYTVFSETVTDDKILRISLAKKNIPEGFFRLTVAGKSQILDEPVTIARDAQKFRQLLQRQRKLSAYSQQQERKKLVGAIKSVSALIKQGQKAKNKTDISGIDRRLKSVVSKEVIDIQSTRHELFFPEGWQAVARSVNALKKIATDPSKRQPASWAAELEQNSKQLRTMEAKVRATTQYR